MPLSGSDRVGIRQWIADLTYAEVHAATLGAMHGVAIVVAHALGLAQLAVGLVVAAGLLLGVARKGLGKRFPVARRLVERIPQDLREQVRDEPHYYGGTLLIASTLAYGATLLL